MNIRRDAARLFTVLTAVSCLHAFDAGGSILAKGELKQTASETAGLEQTETCTAWLRIPLPGAFSFYAEGFYKYYSRNTVPSFDSYADSHEADASSVLLSFRRGPLSAAAGRTFHSDITSLIFVQPCDGMYFGYSSRSLVCSMYGGYTGFINAKTFSVHSDPASFNDDDVHPLCPSYTVTEFKLSAPGLFAGQTLSAECAGFWNGGSGFGGKHRIYATGAASGAISSSLFYTCSSTLGMTGTADMTLSNMSSASVAMYPQFASSCIRLGGVYASRDFVPFTFISASVCDAYSYSSLVKGSLLVSAKPVAPLYVSAEGCVFCPLGKDGRDIFAESCQWQCSVQVQAASDLLLNMSAGQIIPLDSGAQQRLDAAASLQFSL